MGISRWFAAVVVVCALGGAVRSAGQGRPERREVTVWVNTRSHVYHCPGSRWYGRTHYGKYMGECEARRQGNRPAYGRACGSECTRLVPRAGAQPETWLRGALACALAAAEPPERAAAGATRR